MADHAAEKHFNLQGAAPRFVVVHPPEEHAIPLLAMSDRQDLYSMAFVRAIVSTAGFNFSKAELDRNGDDLQIEHTQADGFYPTYSRLIVQVKCTFAHSMHEDGTIHYPLKIGNYNQLRRPQIEPRILVLVLVPRPDCAPPEPWIEYVDRHTIFRYQAYWLSIMGADESSNDDTVTVRVPATNIFDTKAVSFLMKKMVAEGVKNL